MDRFDAELFQQLNEEYRERPLVPKPRAFDRESLAAGAARRARAIASRVPLNGSRVLEVGCGRGDVGTTLVEEFDCEYVGVDIASHSDWEKVIRPGMTFAQIDLTAADPSGKQRPGGVDLGEFDVIVSLAVLEHVRHPYAMLAAWHRLLRPGGRAYLAANLHRGPKASHRYREVYFPWPHLLFSDEVWREWYRRHHSLERTFSWVNKLTYLHYLDYFARIGFDQEQVWLTPSTFDPLMYERFEERLSPYPVHDLSHDFVYAVLSRPTDANAPAAGRAVGFSQENARLRAELAAMRSSRSWQVTAPLRGAGSVARRLRNRATGAGASR